MKASVNCVDIFLFRFPVVREGTGVSSGPVLGGGVTREEGGGGVRREEGEGKREKGRGRRKEGE